MNATLHNHLIFLDYLDNSITNKETSKYLYKQKDQKIRFDVLAFTGSKLLLAAPAIAKNQDTAFILSQYGRLISDNTIKFALGSEYKNNFNKWINHRVHTLERGLSYGELSNNIEYMSYKSIHWEIFYNQFIPNTLKDTSPFYLRLKNADRAFRKNVIKAVTNDDFVDFLFMNFNCDPYKIANCLKNIAIDDKRLFQRNLLIDELKENIGINNRLIFIFKKVIDNAFFNANAEAINSIRSNCFDGINGNRLMFISKNVWVNKKFNLFENILSMPVDTVIELSKQSEWGNFIGIINRIINEKYNQLASVDSIIKTDIIKYFPSRRFELLNNIATMIIAYTISPIFGIGGISRILGSIFTNAPSSIMENILKINCNDLALTTNDMTRKVRWLINNYKMSNKKDARSCYYRNGLYFSAKSGFIARKDIANNNRVE